MILSDLFRRLSYGELSNLSMGNSGSGTIAPEKRNQVTHYINNALLVLTTDLPLVIKNVNIELFEFYSVLW